MSLTLWGLENVFSGSASVRLANEVLHAIIECHAMLASFYLIQASTLTAWRVHNSSPGVSLAFHYRDILWNYLLFYCVFSLALKWSWIYFVLKHFVECCQLLCLKFPTYLIFVTPLIKEVHFLYKSHVCIIITWILQMICVYFPSCCCVSHDTYNFPASGCFE